MRGASASYLITYLLTCLLTYLLAYLLTYLLTYLGGGAMRGASASRHAACAYASCASAAANAAGKSGGRDALRSASMKYFLPSRLASPRLERWACDGVTSWRPARAGGCWRPRARRGGEAAARVRSEDARLSSRRPSAADGSGDGGW